MRGLNADQKMIVSTANMNPEEWRAVHQDALYLHLIRRDGTKRAILTNKGEVVALVSTHLSRLQDYGQRRNRSISVISD